jgi:hypothetical protein
VIGNQHHGSRCESATDASRCIGHQQRINPQARESSNRKHSRRGLVSLVQMKPSALGQHLFAAEPSRNQLAAVPDHRGHRKSWDLLIRYSYGVLHVLGQKAEPRAEHYCNFRPATFQASTNSTRCGVDLLQKLHRRVIGVSRLLNRESPNTRKYRISSAGPRPERRKGIAIPALVPKPISVVSFDTARYTPMPATG